MKTLAYFFALVCLFASQNVADLLVPIPAQAQTTVQQAITINGLPPGCIASMSGAVITVSSCTTPITISLSCAAYNLAVGNTTQCTAVVSNTTNQAVLWTSSNGAILTVNATGLVTAVAVGTATVTATSQQDPHQTATQTFTVTQPATTVTQDASKVTVSSGQIITTPTQDPPIAGLVGTTKLNFPVVGQTYDWDINFPYTGRYIVQARLGTDINVTSGTLSVHFESPVGTNISGALSLSGTNKWATVLSTQIFSVTASTQQVRLVVDTLPTSTAPTPGFIHWFQFTPEVTGTHSVKLTWNAAASPTPCSSPDPPTCPGGCGTTNPDSYRIYRSATSGQYGAAYVTGILPPTTTYTDWGVQAGQTWYYKVTSYSASACTSESAATNEIKVTVPSP